MKKPGVRLFHLLLPLPSCTNLIYRGYFALRGFFSMATLQTTTTHKVLEEMVVQHTQLHDNFLSGGRLKTCHGLPALLTTWTLFFQKFPTPFPTTFELLWNSINFFNVGALTTELKKNQCNLTKAFIEVNSNWSLLPPQMSASTLVFVRIGGMNILGNFRTGWVILQGMTTYPTKREKETSSSKVAAGKGHVSSLHLDGPVGS